MIPKTDPKMVKSLIFLTFVTGQIILECYKISREIFLRDYKVNSLAGELVETHITNNSDGNMNSRA